jgi:hypothetical protein
MVKLVKMAKQAVKMRVDSGRRKIGTARSRKQNGSAAGFRAPHPSIQPPSLAAHFA